MDVSRLSSLDEWQLHSDCPKKQSNYYLTDQLVHAPPEPESDENSHTHYHTMINGYHHVLNSQSIVIDSEAFQSLRFPLPTWSIRALRTCLLNHTRCEHPWAPLRTRTHSLRVVSSTAVKHVSSPRIMFHPTFQYENLPSILSFKESEIRPRTRSVMQRYLHTLQTTVHSVMTNVMRRSYYYESDTKSLLNTRPLFLLKETLWKCTSSTLKRAPWMSSSECQTLSHSGSSSWKLYILLLAVMTVEFSSLKTSRSNLTLRSGYRSTLRSTMTQHYSFPLIISSNQQMVRMVLRYMLCFQTVRIILSL